MARSTPLAIVDLMHFTYGLTEKTHSNLVATTEPTKTRRPKQLCETIKHRAALRKIVGYRVPS